MLRLHKFQGLRFNVNTSQHVHHKFCTGSLVSDLYTCTFAPFMVGISVWLPYTTLDAYWLDAVYKFGQMNVMASAAFIPYYMSCAS